MTRDFSRFLIATDLDGTFICHGRRLPVNERAVEEFKAGGGIFTIATGRLHLNVRAAVGDPRTLLNAPAVLCNGAYLYDFQRDRIVPGTDECMPPDAAREVLGLLRAEFPAMQFRVSGRDRQRFERVTELLADDAASFDPGAVAISAPAEAWPDDDWFKIVVRGTSEDLKRLAETAATRFAGRLFAFFSGPRLFEMQKAGTGKGRGLKKLSALYPDRLTVGCGDYENDLPLLRTADIAVCPATAYDPAKALCNAVLPPCEEGIFPALLDYLAAWQGKEKRAK